MILSEPIYYAALTNLYIQTIENLLFLACLHISIGEEQGSNFLAALNMKPLAQKTGKKREREVCKHIDTIARKSCDEMLEKKLNLQGKR